MTRTLSPSSGNVRPELPGFLERLRGETTVAEQERTPAVEIDQHREVGLVLLLLRERVLHQSAAEAGAGVLVVALHQVDQAAIVERHRPLVWLTLVVLGAFLVPETARLGGPLAVGVDGSDAGERLVEGTGRYLPLPDLQRLHAQLQVVQDIILVTTLQQRLHGRAQARVEVIGALGEDRLGDDARHHRDRDGGMRHPVNDR